MSALKRLGIDVNTLPKTSQISDEQLQTAECFGFKWGQRDSYDSEAMKGKSKKWLFDRYCAGNQQRLTDWLAGERKIILDAGCGSGYSGLIFFHDHLKAHDYLGVDISAAVEIARERFKECGCSGDFLRCDIMDLPLPNDSVDMIFSEGVLHHTDSVEKSIIYLSTKLKNKGRFLFYVYNKKAVVREFTDDYVREHIRGLSDADAWEALKPLTKLGRTLGRLNVEIDVPEDIPYLGIRSGKIDIQRFFYWNICKLFYDNKLNLSELNHINFDWFRPQNCHRHTPEEIEAFCRMSTLKIEHMDIQNSGITVVALKE